MAGWITRCRFRCWRRCSIGYRLIAVDLSGQGLSDHRSSDSTYHIWDDIPQLLTVIDAMRLDRLAVLGHSRGAAIAVLLAAALEDRCSQLVLLDGMLPRPVADEQAPAQFLQAQRDHQRLAKHRPRVFADVGEFVEARVRLGFSEQSARILAPRALRRDANGWSAGSRSPPQPRLRGQDELRDVRSVLRCAEHPNVDAHG